MWRNAGLDLLARFDSENGVQMAGKVANVSAILP
jgi:hypothetical protein